MSEREMSVGTGRPLKHPHWPHITGGGDVSASELAGLVEQLAGLVEQWRALEAQEQESARMMAVTGMAGNVRPHVRARARAELAAEHADQLAHLLGER